MEYGLQLYSVRDITDKDMAGALKSVAAMGYKFVEFAGFFGIPAAEITAMLNEYGLEISGTHTGWREIAENFEDTLAYHKAIGNKNIIIPGADLGDQTKIDAFVEMANKYQPMLAAEGISLGFHNHSGEFRPNADGSMIYSQLELRTNLEFEIDTYWAFNAKVDPLLMMERLKDRVRVIHLKDGDENGHGFALGEGKAPVAAVRQKAIDLGIRMVVESETLTPDGLSEVKRCIDYLKTLDNE